MTERHPDQIRAALAQGEAAAAVAKTFDRSVSPDIEGRTAAERVGRFLDVFENKGGTDRESIMGVGGRRSNHETVELTVADLRELIAPEHRLILAVGAALNALPPGDEDGIPDYTTARELLSALDEATLRWLMILFNEAKDLASKGYREAARRAVTLSRAYTEEAKVNKS